MKSKYTLKSLIENIDQELEKENSPQRKHLESAINLITKRVSSINSAYTFIEDLRGSLRFRDKIDPSIMDDNQLQFSSTLLALFILVSQTGYRMDQSQVDIIINTFASKLSEHQLDDFMKAIKDLDK